MSAGRLRQQIAVGLALAALAATSLSGQQSPAAPRFRAGVDLTTVTATVARSRRTPRQRLLPREAFDVYEDERLQTITQFTNERVPVSLGILLDISDSMFGRRLQEARDAVKRFVADLLDPADDFSILAFNHKPRLLTAWTADRAAVARVLDPLKPSGSTAIYDAITAMLPLGATRVKERFALLVISRRRRYRQRRHAPRAALGARSFEATPLSTPWRSTRRTRSRSTRASTLRRCGRSPIRVEGGRKWFTAAETSSPPSPTSPKS